MLAQMIVYPLVGCLMLVLVGWMHDFSVARAPALMRKLSRTLHMSLRTRPVHGRLV